MEKRQKIILGVSLAAVALGVGAYFIFRPKKNGLTTDSRGGQYSTDDDGTGYKDEEAQPPSTPTSGGTSVSTASEWDDKGRRKSMRNRYMSLKKSTSIKSECDGGRRYGGSEKDIAWYECVKSYSGFAGFSGFQVGANHIEIDTNLTDLD